MEPLLPIVMLLAIALQAVSAGPERDQSFHDDAAARRAGSIQGRFPEHGGEKLESDSAAAVPHDCDWHPVSDAVLRRRSSYHAPPGYRFHRAVRVDLDHDGRWDVVEMVERSRHKALRISYGGGGRVLITARHEGRWTDQGLFAAGDDAVMVNFPESRAYFLFQRGRDLMVEYVGD